MEGSLVVGLNLRIVHTRKRRKETRKGEGKKEKYKQEIKSYEPKGAQQWPLPKADLGEFLEALSSRPVQTTYRDSQIHKVSKIKILQV